MFFLFYDYVNDNIPEPTLYRYTSFILTLVQYILQNLSIEQEWVQVKCYNILFRVGHILWNGDSYITLEKQYDRG